MADSLPFSIYWNGAYDASGGSNLSYCNQGKFGSIVTHTVADLSDSYLPLSGGKMTGQITKDGQSVVWVNGRSGAALRETSVAGYHTLWSLKTTNGSWDFGEYSTSGYYNIPLLTYITDTNFSAGTNSTTYQIKFPLDSGTVALTKNIPSSLKNPYALTIFGVSYDGSATKTVDKTTFISTLEEGTSTVTDGTMFVTSSASDNGFADTNAVNYPYKRKASCLYNYIYTKHPFTGTTFYSGNSSNAEHDANNIVKNGHYYYTSNGPTTSIGATTTDGALYAQSYSDSWVGQIAQDYRNGRLFFRGKNNGTWTDWLTNIDSGNIGNQYVAGASYAYKLAELFSFNNGSSYNKYVLLGTVDITSAWDGFFGIYQFTGAENVWGGIIYIGFRTSSTIDSFTGINLFWLSLTNTAWKDCILLTKETVTVNSVSTTRCRVYIKVPFTYHYTKVGAIYLLGAITHGTGAILDSYEGTLLQTSTFYTTAQIAESGNLYFTNSRAVNACNNGYFRNRGLYSTTNIASSIPAKSELTTANGLSGSYKVQYTGASGQLVQFYDGAGGSARYLQLYTTYSSGLYWRQSTDNSLAKDWRLFLDTTNYSSYVSLNIKDSGSTGGLDQLHDGGDTFDFTGKNPKATTYDSTLTGTLTKGASGNYASSFGGKSIASGKRAFAEGTLTIAQGAYSHAEGGDTVTLGEEAHAEGFMSTAVGQASHAEGHSTVAEAIYSHAEGDQTLASGNVSHAEGYLTKTTAEYSHAEGMNTTASGATSHSEGDATTASGMDSHAEGYSSTAFGDYSHAEGNTTEASGNSSHTEGYNTKATHPYSHAEGMNTTASGDTSHVEGNLSTASGTDSHAEGYSSTASGATAHAEGANTVASGTKAHAEGYATTAQGDHSHAEGSETKALGTASHAEGLSTQASNVYDHAEGMSTVASGTVSHAEGNATKALGADSHAEGKQTTANAASSHAEGFGSYAGGTYSHAQGYYTKTMNDAEFACGKYNATSSNVLFSVGCGTSNNVRKNALTLKYDSTISKSTLYVENIDVSTAKYLKTCIPMQRNIINPTNAIKSNILYIDASSSYTYIFLFSAVDVEQVGSKITIINDCSKNFSIYSSNSYPQCIHYKNTMPSSAFLLEPYSMCELIVIGKTTTDLSTANSKYCAIITSYASIGNTADNSTNVDRFVLPVVAYGAIVCNNYNTSTGDASLYIRYNLGPNVRYNSTTNRMYVTRANPGVYHLYIPKAWFAYAGDIGISLTCMGFAYDSGNTYLNGNATLKAAVTYILATTYNELSCWRITIVTSDDATANDLYPNASSTSGYTSSTSEGRIMFILYGLSRNAPYSSAVLGSPKNANGYYYGKS